MKWRLGSKSTFLLMACGTIAFLIAAGAVLNQAIAARRWSAMRGRVAELLEESRSMPARREVLRGEATPGNAWHVYAELASAAEKIPDRDRYVIEEFLQDRPKSDIESVGAIVEANQGLIDRLRNAVCREDAQFAYEWKQAPDLNGPSALGSLLAGRMCVAKAVLLSCEGRAGEGMDHALVACQFGRDMAHNGTWLMWVAGLVLSREALDSLRETFLLDRLERDQVAALSEALAVLEANLPSVTEILRNETIWVGCSLSREGIISDFPWPLAWRFGFSRRLMVADTFFQFDEWHRREAEACGAGWLDERRVVNAIRSEIESRKSGNILIALLGSTRRAGERQGVLTRARLLRLACHYRAAGEILDLPDPFGERIRWRNKDDRMRAWSVGEDGVDNGGVGEWDNSDAADIVFEFPNTRAR